MGLRGPLVGHAGNAPPRPPRSSAVFRLCDQVIDGGTCTHCNRPTGFTPDLDPMPLDDIVCWYQWDPELSEFRRGCAGSAP